MNVEGFTPDGRRLRWTGDNPRDGLRDSLALLFTAPTDEQAAAVFDVARRLAAGLSDGEVQVAMIEARALADEWRASDA